LIADTENRDRRKGFSQGGENLKIKYKNARREKK
jgi:hypothetical protein